MESDKNIIDDIFIRGVGEFIDPEGLFRKKIEANPKKVIIKFGVDPNRPDIHLGHAVVFRKLRQFQDLGCKVVFLVGDFTATIGDPTGKSKVRPEVDQLEVEKNMKTYLDQVGKILKTDNEVFSWIRNSDWFTAINDIASPPDSKINWSMPSGESVELDANSTVGKALIFENTRMQKGSLVAITLRSFIWTLKHITHSRLIERDMFQQRIKNEEQLYMHEMMYPVLQGIDSFALASIYGSCDLEVGGTDQTFNMLIGRDVMKINKQEPQAVLSFKLLEGLDGTEKMSKSLDNYVAITDLPADMYGKIMSIPDSSILNYFELCTFTPVEDIKNISLELSSNKTNPKDLKMNLAKQIVSIYHGEEESEKAQNHFISVFQNKGIPEEMNEIPYEDSSKSLMDILVESGEISSKGEWRRLISEGAVTDLDTEEKITDVNITPQKGMRLKIGKRRFVKIV